MTTVNVPGGLAYILARLGEPSTWATIMGALVATHVSVDPGVWQHVVDTGMAASGLLGVFLAEKGSTTPPPP